MTEHKYRKIQNHFAKNDKIIHILIKKYGKCNLSKRDDYFIALVESIISQQLSVKSANAIYSKFLKLFRGIPTPKKILNKSYDDLRNAGLSNAKTIYVRDLACQLSKDNIKFENIEKMTENEIHDLLTQVKGIGPWTVHMFLIFTLNRENILPHGDLGIKRAIMLNYNLKKLPSAIEVIELAEKNNWSPYSSVVAWYLWKSLE